MEALTLEEKSLFLEFQERWSLDKVKEMTLEEYTGIGGKERDDFAYWVESKLDTLGSIWGGSAFKFGIFKRNANDDKENNQGRIYTDDYAWLAKYGKTKEEAFTKIKSYIVKIIELSHQNKLNEIENIDLGHSYKWKIAFHYQNINDIRIVCIFNYDVLQKIAKDENLGLGDNPNTAQIYNGLLSNKTYTLETMCEEKSVPLSQKYIENTKGEPMKNNTKTTDNINSIKEFKIPLNQILYGPPGTGKTYHTIDKALEILLEYGEIDSIPETREGKKKIFDEIKERGQIEFITFHQNFSYEEFVEGIKPNTENPENMTYEVRVGIFKNICERALVNYQKSKNKIQDSQINTKEIFQSYALELKQKLDNSGSISFLNKMKIQSVNFNQNGEVKSINIGVDESPMQSLTQEIVLRDYLNFKNGKIKTYKDIKPRYESQSQWHGNAIYYFALMEKLREFEKKDFKPQDNNGKVELKSYILIIDEINRGNISKILGELITLIEPSKRIGNGEELKVTLPYSNEEFGVPKNLYIIGTMNTADRSIALLDTALRRRFDFIEMMPDYEELKKIWLIETSYAERDNTNHLSKKELYLDDYEADKSEILCNILEAINRRIEFLLDREHTIGHAFFFEKAKYYKNNKLDWYELSVEDLKIIFAKKVIPLLQEYFYDDYAKIDAVLNGNGMIESKSMQDLKVKLSDEIADGEKKIYKVTDSKNWNETDFQKIYKLDDGK